MNSNGDSKYQNRPQYFRQPQNLKTIKSLFCKSKNSMKQFNVDWLKVISYELTGFRLLTIMLFQQFNRNWVQNVAVILKILIRLSFGRLTMRKSKDKYFRWILFTVKYISYGLHFWQENLKLKGLPVNVILIFYALINTRFIFSDLHKNH